MPSNQEPRAESKWNKLPTELKFHVVKFTNWKTKLNLRCTSKINKAVVECRRYALDSGHISTNGNLSFFSWSQPVTFGNDSFEHFAYFARGSDGFATLDRSEKAIAFLELMLKMSKMSSLSFCHDDDDDNMVENSVFFTNLKQLIRMKKCSLSTKSITLDVKFMRLTSPCIIETCDKRTLEEIVIVGLEMDDFDIMIRTTNIPLVTYYSSDQRAVPTLSILKMWAGIPGRIGNRIRTDVEEDLFDENVFRDVFGTAFRTTPKIDGEENACWVSTPTKTHAIRVSWSSRTMDAMILQANEF